jgi:hypothetical protein
VRLLRRSPVELDGQVSARSLCSPIRLLGLPNGGNSMYAYIMRRRSSFNRPMKGLHEAGVGEKELLAIDVLRNAEASPWQ